MKIDLGGSMKLNMVEFARRVHAEQCEDYVRELLSAVERLYAELSTIKWQRDAARDEIVRLEDEVRVLRSNIKETQ